MEDYQEDETMDNQDVLVQDEIVRNNLFYFQTIMIFHFRFLRIIF